MPPALALVVLLLPLGYFARRSGRFPDKATDVLNLFVVDICVPAVILRVVPALKLRWELGVLIAIPWGLAALGFALARGLSRLFGFDRQTETAIALCVGLGNTSFLGFPLCRALIGDAALPLAAVYDQLGSFLLLCFLVPVCLAQASGSELPSGRQFALRVATFPPFMALALAFLPWAHPRWLDQMLLEVGNALVPVAMFAVGLRLRMTPPQQRLAFALGLSLKLGLMPLIALLSTRMFSVPHEIRQVAVLESAMPAMISAGAALMAAGIAAELTAALVGWGIVASLLTVPAWALLVR